MSKGSYRRKADVPKDRFDESFDKIFTKPEKKPKENGKKR